MYKYYFCFQKLMNNVTKNILVIIFLNKNLNVDKQFIKLLSNLDNFINLLKLFFNLWFFNNNL